MPKATTSSRATHPFPFFGAGRANYFEWAEVHVRFARAPTPAERKAIAAIVPPPLRDSVRFHGRDLHVASGQFVHHNIYDAYALPDDPVNDENDDDDEIEDGWFFASTAQVNRFNTDTEHWLQAAHNIAPILAAFRREDGEAGGTKLSPWHRKSLARTADVLHECEDVLALGDRYASGAYMVHGILDMAEDGGVAVPDEWKRWHDNPEKEAATRAKTKKAAKKAPSKKASKKASAEKASAKKTPAKKTPAKKTPAKKTSAKKTSAKKAAKKTAKKTPAKKAPAKKVPAKKAAKKAPAKKAAKKAPTKKAS